MYRSVYQTSVAGPNSEHFNNSYRSYLHPNIGGGRCAVLGTLMSNLTQVCPKRNSSGERSVL